MPGWLRTKLFDLAARVLTKPRGKYTLLLPNDFETLLRVLRPGDVILVDGDQRVSEVIKYLTQSTWSHSVLYVGDEILRRFPGQREALLATHARDANHMIIEALMDGVVASPLSKYASFNLRICRPSGLRSDDLRRVLDEVLAQLGVRYDVKHILDLARYFFPVSLIPRRFRRQALQFGSGLTTQVICSSLIGRAFQNVGFPILPTTMPGTTAVTQRRFLDRVLRRTPPPYPALFRRQVPSIITPRDFDLSPYFEVIKFNPVEAYRFDYRRIRWDDSEARAAAGRRSGS
ncbi:MAG TPA: YiiX/YebB-like N1pC/P60 family cysteine hydrolase [Candidatus Binatus sp.]|nr:YiiX/YebB-like N1pC/P60 family cysteine hydrolase [Candidatus Binatus sp.]